MKKHIIHIIVPIIFIIFAIIIYCFVYKPYIYNQKYMDLDESQGFKVNNFEYSDMQFKLYKLENRYWTLKDTKNMSSLQYEDDSKENYNFCLEVVNDHFSNPYVALTKYDNVDSYSSQLLFDLSKYDYNFSEIISNAKVPTLEKVYNKEQNILQIGTNKIFNFEFIDVNKELEINTEDNPSLFLITITFIDK